MKIKNIVGMKKLRISTRYYQIILPPSDGVLKWQSEKDRWRICRTMDRSLLGSAAARTITWEIMEWEVERRLRNL